MTLSDAEIEKIFRKFSVPYETEDEKKHEEKYFFSAKKAIRKAVLFLSRKQEQTLSKSPKNGGRFKRRNDFATTFTTPRPRSFGKLLQKCASRLEDLNIITFSD